MNQFKRAQVIMLPTNKEPIKGNLLLRHIWKEDPKLESNTLWQYKDTIVIDEVKQYTTLNGSFRDWYKAFIAVNLYIISDDEIKEGDWIKLNYELEDGFIYQLIKKEKYHTVLKSLKTGKIDNYSDQFTYKKIIATTDISLTKVCNCSIVCTSRCDKSLHQPSQQFIEKYIESYNKSEIITDILVEYELLSIHRNLSYREMHSDKVCYNSILNKEYIYKNSMGEFCKGILKERNLTLNGIIKDINNKKEYVIPLQDLYELVLKVNSKDNTITIKKLKESWNREEIENLFILFGRISTNKQINFNHKPSEFIADELEINKFLEKHL